jgi:type I restriction-modification system DNA methylase subunit
LKVATESGKHITLECQEKDVTTAGLAYEHDPARLSDGQHPSRYTLAAPKFKDGEAKLRTYDYVVANPPFSDKTWSTGLSPSNDPFQRFAWGEPSAKQGDYAYLLHIIRSMKSGAKAACILPHGVPSARQNRCDFGRRYGLGASMITFEPTPTTTGRRAIGWDSAIPVVDRGATDPAPAQH